MGHKTKYIPAQTTLRDKDGSPQETQGGEQRSFRKEERTPQKQISPKKLRVKESDTQNSKSVPMQSMGSQVREESLEELQPGEQITNTVYPLRIENTGEPQDTEQYLCKPEYQTNSVQGVNQTINMDTLEKGIYQFMINQGILNQLIQRLSMKGNLQELLLGKRSHNLRNIL